MRRLGKLAVAGVALVAGLGTALVATDEANGPAPAGGQTLREPWRPLPRSTATRVRGFHSLQSFWTGSEVLVLAGAAYSGDRVAAAAYDPAAGRWRRLARSPLGWRFGQASVWTGSELIVWGGTSAMGERTDGARYDPVSDSWTAISRSPLRQPYARTAVWTGKEMLVWGGGSAASDGEAYDPGTDRWRRIAPSPLRGRFGHTAVWTGPRCSFGPDGASGGAGGCAATRCS